MSVACAFQIVIYAVLQFIGSTQVLEVHYFSSLLWASVMLTLAITIAELGAPILEHVRYRWLIPVVLLAVPLVFELNPTVPQFGWMPVGLVIVVMIVVLAWFARREAASHDIMRSRLLIGGAIAAISAGLLVLTVTPTQHKHERGTVVDTFPDYAYTLGGTSAQWGNDSTWVNLYADTTAMHSFVGDASYSGEQLLMWWNTAQLKELREPIGIFHAFFDSIPTDLGTLTPLDKYFLGQRHPAQILLMSLNGQGFQAVAQFPEALWGGAGSRRRPDVGIGVAAPLADRSPPVSEGAIAQRLTEFGPPVDPVTIPWQMDRWCGPPRERLLWCLTMEEALLACR